MNDNEEQLLNAIMDSLYDCIDFLNLISDQQDLSQSIDQYLGALKLLKRELDRNLVLIQQLMQNEQEVLKK